MQKIVIMSLKGKWKDEANIYDSEKKYPHGLICPALGPYTCIWP